MSVYVCCVCSCPSSSGRFAQSSISTFLQDLEKMMDEDRPSNETLSYVLNSYEKLPLNASSKSALRESFLNRINLKSLRDTRHYCKYCCYLWSEGNYTMKILPKKMPGKRICKLLKKKTKCPEKLSSFEKNLIKYIEHHEGNKLVLTCSVCKRKTTKRMNKQKISHKSSDKRPHEVLEEKKGKKKKKKKDSFAGLKPDIVLKSASLRKEDTLTSLLNFQNEKGKSNLKTPCTRIDTSPKKKSSSNPNLGSSQSAENKMNKNDTFFAGASQSSCEGKVSFLEKLAKKMEKEHIMKRENVTKNRQKRKLLKLQMEKSKPSLTDFKNFLRDLGKPV